MNSPWSAWANETLTAEERDALAAIGVAVDPGVSNVVVAVDPFHLPASDPDSCEPSR